MTEAVSQAALVTRCARELFDAESARCPIEPLTARYPALTVADAYAIQRANVERRIARGECIVGHKIGLTAKAMQEKFGVS
ncbi:MAG TPA: hypothetical protein VLD39_03760, partial [Gammaproteobacteria bacterium]|nr:hypothetical protein [Gammaproteobacteria bacterium]